MAFKPSKKGVVSGTKKNDKITWVNQSAWKKALTVNANNGNDVINFKKSKYKNKLNGQNGNDTIYGGTNNDTIKGGNNNDKMYGYKGNDYIYAGAGKDTVYGGYGNDKIWGNSGNNLLKGEAGNDSIYAGTGNDTIYGGSGNDVINLSKGGKNKVYGEAGNDTITFGFSDNYIDAGDGNDVVKGTAGNNTIKGGKGNDTITSGMSGRYNIDGGDGNDLINAGDAGNTTINGGNGNDTIYGSFFDDNINGGAGDDSIFGADGNNTLNGGDGNDTITASSGTNTINAGAGINEIHLSDYITHDNTIISGGGTDTLFLDNQTTFDGLPVEYVGDDLVITNFGHVILKDFKTTEHSVKFVSIAGETRPIDSIAPAIPREVGVSTIQFDGNAAKEEITTSAEGAVLVNAGGGNDIVNSYGEDTIYGGTGNDTINLYNNEYKEIHINAEDGDDVINGVDQTLETNIVFETNEIFFNKDGNNLIIMTDTEKNGKTYSQNTTVTNFYNNDGTVNTDVSDYLSLNGTPINPNNIKFLHDMKQLHEQNYTSTSTTGEVIRGTSSANSITGGTGDDIIYGMGGNDIITGGSGNDTIYLGEGNSTVQFSSGAGSDELHVGTAATSKTIISCTSGNLIDCDTNGNDLQIFCGNYGNKLTIKDYLNRTSAFQFNLTGTNYEESFYVSKEQLKDKVIIQGNGGTGEDLYFNDINNYEVKFFFDVNNVAKTGDEITYTTGNDLFITNFDDEVSLAPTKGIEIKDYFNANGRIDEISAYNTINKYARDMDVSAKYIAKWLYANGFESTAQAFASNKKNELLAAYQTYDLWNKEFAGSSEMDRIDLSDYNSTVHTYGGNDYFYCNTGNQKVIVDAASANKNLHVFMDYNSGDDIIELNSKLSFLGLHIQGADEENKNLKFIKEADNLIIERKNPIGDKDTITVKNYFNADKKPSSVNIYNYSDNYEYSNEANYIGGINFYVSNYSEDEAFILRGTDGNDTVSTDNSGKFIIYTEKGNDIINLNGTGNTEIYFAYGSGNDTLVFNAKPSVLRLHIEGADKTNKNLNFVKSGNDLLIERTNPDTTTDTITIKDYYTSANITISGNFTIYDYEQNSITTLTAYINNYSKHKAIEINGTESADTITADSDNHNYIIPGKGNDTINIDKIQTAIEIKKGDGNDTVIFTSGGQYVYTDFLFDSGTEVEFQKSGDNLIIAHTTDGLTENLTINDYFKIPDEGTSLIDTASRHRIFLGDDTVSTSIYSLLVTGDSHYISTTGAGAISGTSLNDSITGSAGVDTITMGSNGRDIITAGKGNDTIIYTGNPNTNISYGEKTFYFHNGDGNDTIQIEAERIFNSMLLMFDENTDINFDISGNNLLVNRTYDNEGTPATETLTIEDIVAPDSNIIRGIYYKIGEMVNNEHLMIFNCTENGYNNDDSKNYSATNKMFIGNDEDNVITSNNYIHDSWFFGGEGSDTYNIKSTKQTSDYYKALYTIDDEAGADDVLNLTARTASETKLFFEVNNVVSATTYDVADDLYLWGDVTETRMRNMDEGIVIKNYFGTGEIETITDQNGLTVTQAQINAIAQSVAGWLTDNGYTSTADALADENLNISGLIAAYKPEAGLTWQSAS